MIFDKVNIAEELKKERDKISPLMDEVSALLFQSSQKEVEILNRLKGNENNKLIGIVLNEKDNENIFSIRDIESICITYRLRFLDSQYFKSEFPYEAINSINDFEKRYDFKIDKFKIIAPDKAFDLQDANQDPLLFAQLSDTTFYLIHKWGNDLVWYRKFLYLPIRTVYTYFYSIIVLSFIVSFSFPFSWLQVERNNEMYIRFWFAMHCTIGFFFLILFIGAITQSSFSSMNWKSKYFNE